LSGIERHLVPGSRSPVRRSQDLRTKRAQLHAAAKRSTQTKLLNPRAATLNQNSQYHNNQHTGHNPDN
jgi:hypothetical protein